MFFAVAGNSKGNIRANIKGFFWSACLSARGTAKQGMAMAGSGDKLRSILGPTIMDVNSGWVLPSGAHQPLAIYRKGSARARVRL